MAAARQTRDWISLYKDYQKSGTSLQDYAKQVGLTGSWLSKKFRSMKKAGLLPEEEAEEKAETGFIPVMVKEVSGETEEHRQPGIRITIGKAVIELPCTLDESSLVRILKAVSEAC